METFEIKREDDGTTLGRFRARTQGKLVAEVLKNMKKKLGHDGILLDDTTELTDTDLLNPGHIYKFRQSIHIDAPSAAGLPFCKLPQQVKEVADEYESSRAKKPKLVDVIDDSKLRVHHHQAPESLTSMSEPSITNSLQKKLQSPPSLVLPVMVAECRVLVEEYFSKGIFEFKVQELKERCKMRFGFRLDEKAKGYESIDEFLQYVMPGQGLRSIFKGTEKFVTCETKHLNQNFLKKHSGITMEEVRAWLEDLVSSGRASLGIDLSHIRHDFENLMRKPLDYKSLHHGSLMKLLLQFEDLVRIERCGCRIMVFPRHGTKVMSKKPQMRVVNDTLTMQQEKIIKPVGVNYIRPRKNVLLMKRIKPEVPQVPPGDFPVPNKLQVTVEDPICSTIAMAMPRSSILEELVQPVEVLAKCRSSDSTKVVADLTDPILSMARSSVFEEIMQPVKVENCRISSDPSEVVAQHLKTHENCIKKGTLRSDSMTDPICPMAMAMPSSSILEEIMLPVKVANCKRSDSSNVAAHLKAHENCSLIGSLHVTECRAKEVAPICIHELPQKNPPSSPIPDTLMEVRAAAAITATPTCLDSHSLKAVREREKIKNTLQSISHVLTALDKDRERIRRRNIATNTAIKKRMASIGLECGAFLEESGGQDFNSFTLGG